MRAGTLCYRSLEAHAIAQKSSLGNHDAVIDTKATAIIVRPICKPNSVTQQRDLPLVRCEHFTSPLLSHDSHHFLKPQVACGQLASDNSEM